MCRYIAIYAAFVTACSSGGGGGLLTDGGVVNPGDGGTNTADSGGTLPTAAELCVYWCPVSCPAKPAPTDCKTTCNASFTKTIERVRPEFLRAYYACLKTTPCDQRENCSAQASTMISSTPAAEDACTTVGETQTRCGVTPNRDACVLDLKKFNDTYLAAVKGCFAKACAEVKPCIDAL